MEVTVTEFQALADVQSQQALTIAQLTHKLEEKERSVDELFEEFINWVTETLTIQETT